MMPIIPKLPGMQTKRICLTRSHKRNNVKAIKTSEIVNTAMLFLTKSNEILPE